MKKASATMLSAGLRLAGWLGLAWAILLAGVVCAQSATGVGFQAITIHDPVNGDSMPG